MNHSTPGLPCPSPTPRVYSNPCPSSQWCHPAISSSVIPFSPCLQSFPASWSFQMSQLFASGGQNIGNSASTSVLPMNTQDWSPLGWTGWISLQSKGLSRVFSNTWLQSLGWEDLLEEGMATHSSILVWRQRRSYRVSTTERVKNTSFMWIASCPSTVKEAVLSHWMILAPLLNISHRCVRLSLDS